MDLSRHLGDLLSSTRRAHKVPTTIIAVLVTALVVLPFLLRDEVVSATVDPADAQSLVMEFGDDQVQPVDRQTITGEIQISFEDPVASGVSFSLFESGSTKPILRSQDLEGPKFDLVRDEQGNGEPFDSTRLGDGPYELFITVDTPSGERRTAVSFLVDNS